MCVCDLARTVWDMSSHVAAIFTNQYEPKCWQWEDSKCNGVRVYNEHEGFGLRFVIKFLTKERKKPKEIHKRMDAVYSDVSPSYSQIKFRPKQFKWGRESIEDNSRSCRPVEASSKEMCQKAEDMTLQDCRVKVSVIAYELGISAAQFSISPIQS